MYVVGLLAVLGMAGFALDLGRAYLAKTRLQNAVDAAALAGAKTLFVTGSSTAATSRAQAVYTANATKISGGTAVVEFSATQGPFNPGALNPKYVRVTVAGLPVSLYLSQVFGAGSTAAVDATAVAGPQWLDGNLCGAPMGICAANPASGDSNCADGNGCFGLSNGELTAHDDVTTGNYGLLDLGNGTSDVADSLAGTQGLCLSDGNTQTAKPGASNAIINALNSRFALAVGKYNDPSTYPPDLVITPYPSPLLYPAYQTALASGPYATNGVAKRRTILVPVIDCSLPMAGTSKPITILGRACMFLTRPVDPLGPTAGTVYLQIIDACLAEGGVPVPGGNDSGAARIVLHQAGTQS